MQSFASTRSRVLNFDCSRFKLLWTQSLVMHRRGRAPFCKPRNKLLSVSKNATRKLPWSFPPLHTASQLDKVPRKRINSATFVSTLWNQGQTTDASDMVRSSETVGFNIANNLPIVFAPSFSSPHCRAEDNFPSYAPTTFHRSETSEEMQTKRTLKIVKRWRCTQSLRASSMAASSSARVHMKEDSKTLEQLLQTKVNRASCIEVNKLESSGWDELTFKLSLQQQKKKMSNPSTGYAFRKPSDLINSIEWRSYYAKLVDHKGVKRPGKASAVFSRKNHQYDQMFFNDCVIDISASYPFGLVHLKQNSIEVGKQTEVLPPQNGYANDNQFREQTQVTSPFFKNFKGVQKKNFFTNSKIMMRPFIRDKQFSKIGVGSFMTRTQIPILGCASNQPLLPIDTSSYKAIVNSSDVVQSWCTVHRRRKDVSLLALASPMHVSSSFASPMHVHGRTSRQRINGHSLSFSFANLSSHSQTINLPALPLESLYNKFHTLPIFSTFIYKEWSHRFSFLEYFIWSARKNDLELPFYNRRGACHTTRVNSINLIRNQIGAKGMCVAKEQFLFGFNGCSRKIFLNERSQKAQLEQFDSLKKKNAYLPLSFFESTCCNIENVTQIEQATMHNALALHQSSELASSMSASLASPYISDVPHVHRNETLEKMHVVKRGAPQVVKRRRRFTTFGEPKLNNTGGITRAHEQATSEAWELLSKINSPRFDHSMQSATLFSVISNDNCSSSPYSALAKRTPSYIFDSETAEQVVKRAEVAKNSAEMWGKVDDTQQFPRLAELLHFTGGTALRHLLSRFNLVLLGKFIRHELKNLELKVNFLLALKMLTYSQGLLLGKLAKRRSKQIRRLKLLELFQSKKSNPEWMILSVLPVLPPDLRPILRVNDDFVVASDLNRLYQTVLRRNNTIHERLDDPLPCPESGLFRQRSLQKAVDGLLENGKGGGTPLCASKRRPLVSLSHVLKGKKGLFRQHLLGKRVDYSGRSVIVVGPKLNLHECGLPKEMALELFQPFLIHRLKVKGLATSNTTARRMIQQEDPIIWHTVKQLVYEHPVLLNRAPTLHRLGIQAFQPRLVSGRAILLHPLVCNGFNADFDGDQMAVHVPLSFQARAEAWKIMWSKNNLLSPATGQPILVPSQDMVLGCYYLSVLVPRVGSFKGAEETLPVRASSIAQSNSDVSLLASSMSASLACTCIGDARSVTSKEMHVHRASNVIEDKRQTSQVSAPCSAKVPGNTYAVKIKFDTKPPKNDSEINEVAKINSYFPSKPIYFPGYFKKTRHLGFLTDTNFALHGAPTVVKRGAPQVQRRFTSCISSCTCTSGACASASSPTLRFFDVPQVHARAYTSLSSSNSYVSLLSHLIDRRLFVEPKVTPFELLKNKWRSTPILEPPLCFTGNALSASEITSFFHSQIAPKMAINKAITNDNSLENSKNSAYHLKRGHYFSNLQDSLMAYSQGRLQTHTPFWVRLDYSVADVNKNGTISPLVCASIDKRFFASDASHVTLEGLKRCTTSVLAHAPKVQVSASCSAKVHLSETSPILKVDTFQVLQTQVHCEDNSKNLFSIKNENNPPSVFLKTAVVPSLKTGISQLLYDNACTRVADLPAITSDSASDVSLLGCTSLMYISASCSPRVHPSETSLSALAPHQRCTTEDSETSPTFHYLRCTKMHVVKRRGSSDVNSAFSGSTKVSLYPRMHNRRMKVQPQHITIFRSQNELDMVSFLHSPGELKTEKIPISLASSIVKRRSKPEKKAGENSWFKSATNDLEISSLVTNYTLFLKPQYGRSQELYKVLIASSLPLRGTHKEDHHRCVIEGNDKLEAPLELRLAADGNLVKISTTFQNQYNCNATILDQYKEISIRYMRTTAGRVVINDKIVHLVNKNVF